MDGIRGFFDYIKILNEAFQLLVIDIIEDEEDPHYFCLDIDSHWDFEEGFLWGMYPIHDNMRHIVKWTKRYDTGELIAAGVNDMIP